MSPSKRWIAGLVALVAVLGVAWLTRGWLAEDAGASAATPAARVDAATPAPPIAEPSAPAEVRAVAPEPAKSESVEVARATSESETPAPAAVAFSFGGRLILLDPDGRELPAREGNFRVLGWHGEIGHGAEASVADGHWTVKLPAESGEPTHLTFDAFVIDGRRATLEEPHQRFEVPPGGQLDLRVHLPRRSILRVVDAERGTDLGDVTLVRGQEFPDDHWEHPGLDFDERVVGRTLTSPIALDELTKLEPRGQTNTLLVGCAGYAWARTEIDVAHGGERVVSLVRGANLAVSVTGLDPKSHTALRIRRRENEGQPLSSLELGSRDTFQLDGLAPGALVLRGEVGQWFDQPRVLGEATVEVVAGTTQSVTLALQPPPQQNFADCAGRAYVAHEWEATRLMVTAQLLDTALGGSQRYQNAQTTPLESDRAGFDCFAWKFPKLQVGRYELGIFQPRSSIVVELPLGGRDDFVLEVGAPVDVAVRVVDADTGADVVVQSVHWNPVRPEGVTGGVLDSAAPDKAAQRYRFRAAAGQIELSLNDANFTSASGAFTIAAPRAELTLSVRPSCGFVLRLKDGDSGVPIPQEWMEFPKDSAGVWVRGSVWLDPLGRRYQIPEPGRYTLTMPKIAGYRQPPDQTVDVVARTFVELVVQLEREHP